MKKSIIGLVVGVILIIAGVFLYKANQLSQYKAALVPMVKNASIRVTNSSRLDLAASSVTYKELFERLDTDVSEIEKRVIDVQSATSTATAKISEPAIAYLQSCQEFSRALSQKYRKQFSLSNAIDRSTESVAAAKNSNGYGAQYARERMDRTFVEMTKASKEYNESMTDFLAATKKLKAARAAIVSDFQEDALIPAGQLDQVIAKSEKAQAAKS
jgi:hypothetical protein